MPPSDLAKLEPVDQKILSEIDRGIEGKADLIIPADTPPQRLLTIIRGLTGIIENSEKRISAATVLLSHALYLARNSSAFLEDCGFLSIGEFIKNVIEPKVSRTVAYAISTALDKMNLTISEAVHMGTQTMIAATQVLGKNPSTDFVAKVKTMALESENEKEFKKKLADAGNIVEGGLDTGRLTLQGPVPDINDLREHLDDHRFQRWALEGELGREDFKDAHLMILAAIEHSSPEWPEEEQPDIPPHGPIAQDGGPGGW